MPVCTTPVQLIFFCRKIDPPIGSLASFFYDIQISVEVTQCQAGKGCTVGRPRDSLPGSSVPEKITIDGSAANKSTLEEYNNEKPTSIEIRQVKYLNNIVEQDH